MMQKKTSSFFFFYFKKLPYFLKFLKKNTSCTKVIHLLFAFLPFMLDSEKLPYFLEMGQMYPHTKVIFLFFPISIANLLGQWILHTAHSSDKFLKSKFFCDF